MKNVDSNTVEPIFINNEHAKNVTARLLISKADGAPNFSMRLFELERDGHSFLHTHDYEHVIFFLQGSGEFFFEGSTYPVRENHAVLVPPNKLHQFRNTGETPMKFLCMIPNGIEIPDNLK